MEKEKVRPEIKEILDYCDSLLKEINPEKTRKELTKIKPNPCYNKGPSKSYIQSEERAKLTISKLILSTKKPRKERDDAFYSPKRTSNKYKGRKKDEIWNTLKEAESILSGWSNAKWQKRLNISEDEFNRLIDDGMRYLIDLSENTKNKINVSLSTIQKVTDKKTIKEFISQLFVLGDVFITFVTELDKAERQGDSSFLNKARGPFNFFIAYTLGNSKPLIKGVKGKGRNITWKATEKRLEKVREYISLNKKSDECFVKGRDFSECRDEYLIYLAFKIYYHFYWIPIVKAQLENERQKAINQILELMQKYHITIENIIPPQTTSNKS